MAEYIQHLCHSKKSHGNSKREFNNPLAKWFLIQMMPKKEAPERMMATTYCGYVKLVGD